MRVAIPLLFVVAACAAPSCGGSAAPAAPSTPAATEAVSAPPTPRPPPPPVIRADDRSPSPARVPGPAPVPVDDDHTIRLRYFDVRDLLDGRTLTQDELVKTCGKLAGDAEGAGVDVKNGILIARATKKDLDAVQSYLESVRQASAHR